MEATQAEKKELTLSVPPLHLRSNIKSALSCWSRSARGAWRRNVTRYLVKRRGLEKPGPFSTLA